MKLEEYEDDLKSYAVEITKYLISRGSQLQDAEDVVQDTFVKLLEMDLFLAPNKLRAFMYRTSIRNYIDKYRRSQHYTQLLEQLGRDLTDYEIEEEPAFNLAGLMKRLKPHDEWLLHAYYFENKSTKELASLMNVSLSKTKVDLFRARKKLQKILEKEEIRNA